MNIQERIQKEFCSVPLRPGNMPFYSVRSSILAFLKAETASLYGTVLDVGCGYMPYRQLIESVPAVNSYVGMDIAQTTYSGEIEPDLKWDSEQIPADDKSFECVIATEFLEHHPEPEIVLKEILRVMKPNGIFLATVPFIWNLHEIPHDEYRYTPYSLERCLSSAGFRNIKIKPLGGWNMAFAQMIGLWLGFSPMSRFVRPFLKILFFPFYAYLVKTDKRSAGFDGYEQSMFNGLGVTARR